MISIEMYIGWTDHRWSTDFINIPVTTPTDQIEEKAKEVMLAELEKQGADNVAFVGVYHFSLDDQSDTD